MENIVSLLVVGTCVYWVATNKIFKMARYKDKTEVTRQNLQDFSKALREIAAMIDGDAAHMAQNNIDRIEATHGKTKDEATDGIVKFCGAVRSAIAETVLASSVGSQPHESQQKTEPPEKEVDLDATKKPQSIRRGKQK